MDWKIIKTLSLKNTSDTTSKLQGLEHYQGTISIYVSKVVEWLFTSGTTLTVGFALLFKLQSVTLSLTT